MLYLFLLNIVLSIHFCYTFKLFTRLFATPEYELDCVLDTLYCIGFLLSMMSFFVLHHSHLWDLLTYRYTWPTTAMTSETKKSDTLKIFCKKYFLTDLDLSKIFGITTDRLPSMVGKKIWVCNYVKRVFTKT